MQLPREGSSSSTEQDMLNTDCSRWSKNWLWFQQPVYPNRTELPTAQPCNSKKQAKNHKSRTSNWEDSAITDCQEMSFTLKTFPQMSRVWQSNVWTTGKQTQASCNRITILAGTYLQRSCSATPTQSRSNETWLARLCPVKSNNFKDGGSITSLSNMFHY